MYVQVGCLFWVPGEEFSDHVLKHLHKLYGVNISGVNSEVWPSREPRERHAAGERHAVGDRLPTLQPLDEGCPSLTCLEGSNLYL